MKYAFFSSPGRVKRINQDSFLLRFSKNKKSVLGMAAVCDGVSGLAKGEVASRFVIEQLNDLFERNKTQGLNICDELQKIHEKLLHKAAKQHIQMGTTLSLLIFNQKQFDAYQIGDSRMYVWDRELLQISCDQTLAQRKYDEHTISLQEFKKSKERHILTQCMGVGDKLDIGHREGEMNMNQVYFLCSDGQSNRLKDMEIKASMKRFQTTSQANVQKIVEMMATQVMDRKESDNITSMMFSLEEEE